MKNLFNLPVLLLVAAIAFTGCSKDDPEDLRLTGFDVTYREEFANTIYPSFIYGLSQQEVVQGESFDYFTITVNPDKETDLRIVVEASRLNDETVITKNAVMGKTFIIPEIKWKYDDFKNLSQAGMVDMTFIVYNGAEELARKNLKLSYKSINECVLYFSDNGRDLNLTSLLAAYVNENSPVIDAFMKEVLDEGLISHFTGYQLNSDEEVYNQVEAIFTRLRNKGVKYSDLAAGSVIANKYLMSQHIRFADEVLNSTQANCADGVVFFCSVLQKIGIKTLMIFKPGHVYLGFYLNSDKSLFNLLETTLVGNTNYSFSDAVDFQRDEFITNIEKYQDTNFLDGYFIVDVSEARKFVQPIGR
jgi:hypothetical protein